MNPDKFKSVTQIVRFGCSCIGTPDELIFQTCSEGKFHIIHNGGYILERNKETHESYPEKKERELIAFVDGKTRVIVTKSWKLSEER